MLPFAWYKKTFPLWARTMLFVVFAAGASVILFPYLLLSISGEWGDFEMGAWRWAGVPLLVAGSLFYLRCLWEFAARGRGTPSPLDPPERLVTEGVYRYVRNPMYVAVGTMIVGEALFFESTVILAYLMVIWLAAHLFILGYEEPTLRKLFGETYDDYCRATRRWLPGVRGGRLARPIEPRGGRGN